MSVYGQQFAGTKGQSRKLEALTISLNYPGIYLSNIYHSLYIIMIYLIYSYYRGTSTKHLLKDWTLSTWHTLKVTATPTGTETVNNSVTREVAGLR